jgi:predicted small lipoprotein YifL
MKNKIVKALVLASIVSMTATGAAGLTFADDDVVTGDTTTTSTEATTTTKTVDQLAEALTEAQEDAATKEAAFTKAYEDNEAAKAALDAVVEYPNAVGKQEKERDWNQSALNQAEQTTKGYLDTVKRAADAVQVTAPNYTVAKAASEKVQAVIDAYTAYSNKKEVYKTALGDAYNPTTDDAEAISNAKKAAAKAKTEYEGALKTFNEALAKATEDEFIKGYDGTIQEPNPNDYKISRLTDSIATEEKYRKAVDEAMSAIKTLKDERSEIDEDEVYARGATAGLARRALKKATKEYKDALANVKTAKENYTTATKDLVPVFRVFHPGTMEHLYTTGAHERDVLVEKGWKDEKVAWLTVGKDAEDAAPVYRLCYPGTGDHHYTTDKNERDTLIKTQGWIDETVAFYVPKKGDASVYRVYLSSLKIGAHHFTTGRNEYDTLVQNGWRPEGVSFEVSAKDWIDVSDIKTEDERIAKAEELTKD